jgi:hypothetical protein
MKMFSCQVAVGGRSAAGAEVGYGKWPAKLSIHGQFLTFAAGRRGPNVQGLRRFEAMDAPPMGGGGC